jgi:hypothetical protein
MTDEKLMQEAKQRILEDFKKLDKIQKALQNQKELLREERKLILEVSYYMKKEDVDELMSEFRKREFI